ncbi:MAG: CBS domain-containing protein, partial [archaeon]
DIVWAISKKSKKDLADVQAKDLMKRKVITIRPGADIIEAMEKFKKETIRRLPVVENGKLIGIITANDILRIDPGLFQIMSETIKIKEETEKLKRSDISALQEHGTCEECGEFDVLYHDESQWLCESCYAKR